MTPDFDEDVPTRPINAYFEKQLPEILNAISEALMGAKPILTDIQVRVRELHDYLSFEIEKARLEIAKNARDDIAPEQQAEDELWLGKLEYILTEFQSDSVLSSVNFLEELRKELQSTFMRE